MGISSVLQAHSKLDLLVSASSFLHVSSPLLLHAFAKLDSSLLALKAATVGSPLSICTMHAPGSPFLVRGLSCLDTPSFVMSSAASDASLPVQSLLQLGFTILAVGCARLGSFYALSVESLASLDIFLFVHTVARLGSALSGLDSVGLGFLTSLQSFCHPDLSLACLRSTVDSVLSIASSSHMGASLFSRGFSCVDTSSLVFEPTKLESPPLTRARAQLDMLPLPLAKSRSSFSLSAFAECQLGLMLILHGLSTLGLTPSCFHLSSLDSMSLSQRSAQLDLSIATGSAGRLEPFLPAFHFANLGSPFLLRSACQASFLVLVLDSSLLGLFSFVRKFAQLDLILPLCGLTCFGFTTSALSFSNSDLTLSVQGFSRLDASFLSIHYASLGPFSSIQSFA